MLQRKEMIYVKKMLMFGIPVLVFLLVMVQGAYAHPNGCQLKCGWKTVCEDKPFWEANHFHTLGKCVSDCRHDEQYYQCPSTGPCCEQRCKALTPVCTDKWTCEWVCPDPTPTPTPTPEPTPSPEPEEKVRNCPYSEAIWTNMNCRNLLNYEPNKVLTGGHTYTVYLWHVSSWDGILSCAYYEGEGSYDKNCTTRYYFNQDPFGVSIYGGLGVYTYTFEEPDQQFGFLAVKDFASPLPMVMLLKDDDTGETVDRIITSDQTLFRVYALTDDLRGCRVY